MAVDFPRPVVHGGTGKRQRENTGKNLLDFSASLNPLPPRFAWHCDPACLSSYPDNGYTRLKECIAQTFHRDPDEICVGNGSIELIRVFCSVALSGKKTYFTESPRLANMRSPPNLPVHRQQVLRKLPVSLLSATPITRPGNCAAVPICWCVSVTCHRMGGPSLLTRHSLNLQIPASSIVDVRNKPLFLLRSLTKSFAVPGIRFGYGFGDPDLIAKIETARPPWSVNAYAEAFALEAFRHLDELGKAREYIRKERDRLSLKSKNSGCGVMRHQSITCSWTAPVP